MIINVNGVNVDTNTMRTDAEINALIDSKTANMDRKTLIGTVAINATATSTSTDVPFSINNDAMINYKSLLFVFSGTMRMTASSTQTSFLYFRIRPTGSSEGYFINLSADRGKTCELSNAQLLMNGSNLYKTVKTDGSTVYERTYSDGVYNFEFKEGLSGLLSVMPSNSPSSVYVNGTVNIYGIK